MGGHPSAPEPPSENAAAPVRRAPRRSGAEAHGFGVIFEPHQLGDWPSGTAFVTPHLLQEYWASLTVLVEPDFSFSLHAGISRARRERAPMSFLMAACYSDVAGGQQRLF